MVEFSPLPACLSAREQVARCTKIINAGQEDAKYVINVRQIAKFVVGLGEKVNDRHRRQRVGCFICGVLLLLALRSFASKKSRHR